MIDVNEIKVLTDLLLNKSQGGNYTSPDKLNSIFATAELDIINKYFEAYQANQAITDALKGVWNETAVTTDSNGEFDLPSDYYHTVSITSQSIKGGVLVPNYVERIRQAELQDRLRSSIVGPSQEYPIALSIGDKMRIYPQRITSGEYKLTYISKPTEPSWGFSVTNNRPVYDASSSTNFSLPYSVKTELVSKILEYFGVNMREELIVQYSNKISNDN